MKLRIHSGGQTGADLAGLWVAKTFNLPTGGVAPYGYLTKEGNQPTLKTLFSLKEKGNYQQRTIQNVREADLTLIFSRNVDSTGTALTKSCALRLKKPYFIIPDLRHEGESLRQYWGSKTDFRHTSFYEALFFLFRQDDLRSRVNLDDYFIINVAGNSVSKQAPEAFEFAFVSFWFMMMLYGFGLEIRDQKNFAKDFTDVDPVDLAAALKQKGYSSD